MPWCTRNRCYDGAITIISGREGPGQVTIIMKLAGKVLVGVVLVAVVAGGGWYFYNKGSQEFVIKPGERLTDEQVTRLIDRVSKFLVLPEGEQPSVAAISDVAALAERQPFYKDAKDGDILLVFSSKAIIYDAVNDKLVNVGPIVRTDDVSPTGETPAPTATPEPVEPEAIDIEIRNGTATAGLAGAMASELPATSRVAGDSWKRRCSTCAAVTGGSVR